MKEELITDQRHLKIGDMVKHVYDNYIDQPEYGVIKEIMGTEIPEPSYIFIVSSWSRSPEEARRKHLDEKTCAGTICITPHTTNIFKITETWRDRLK